MKERFPWTAVSPLKMIALAFILLSVSGCERPDPAVTIVASPGAFSLPPTPLVTPFADGSAPPTPLPAQPVNAPSFAPLPEYMGTPTPDPPHYAGSGDSQPFVEHNVSAGETLGYIAQLYGSSVEELQAANQLGQADLVYVGQVLQIPRRGELAGSNFKIIPDSELVYGPAAKGFDVRAFVEPFDSYLLTYHEEVEGRFWDGPAIVQLVADRHSVNPRLLLAVLEYQSEWVTQPAENVTDDGFPLRRGNGAGLYKQLSWAADALNWGYYGRSEANITSFLISDGTRLAFDPVINDGTAGAQAMLGAYDAATYQSWQFDVGPNGLSATFNRLFGNPFVFTVDPLWPVNLTQPPMKMPWADGETWYFTGGPHGGWNTGSAWAALDFTPTSEQNGCVQSDAWVTAVTDGVVARSDFGAVVVDMDGDGYAGTGWAVLYMHLEPRDRIATGTFVQTGDRIGHPSCEGGYSNGTHLHIARLYNGRWVSADGPIPFDLGGWVSQGLGREYDGFLIRGNETKEACECREELNAITGD
ncbi:MAG: LysM peptidoglycan-binding domain-containing protein [Chloroflexi bacterium]|nr:LysM peptidoglycan-binding domain-containing protein [Chloroflexota bacterium]